MLNYRFMILSLGSARTDFHILACFHTILYTSAEPPFTSCVKCLILDGLFTTALQGKPVCSDSWATAKQLFYEAHGLSFRELCSGNDSPELNMFKLKLEPEQWVIPVRLPLLHSALFERWHCGFQNYLILDMRTRERQPRIQLSLRFSDGQLKRQT